MPWGDFCLHRSCYYSYFKLLLQKTLLQVCISELHAVQCCNNVTAGNTVWNPYRWSRASVHLVTLNRSFPWAFLPNTTIQIMIWLNLIRCVMQWLEQLQLLNATQCPPISGVFILDSAGQWLEPVAQGHIWCKHKSDNPFAFSHFCFLGMPLHHEDMLRLACWRDVGQVTPAEASGTSQLLVNLSGTLMAEIH